MPRIIKKLSAKDNLILLKMHNKNFSSSYWEEDNWNHFLSPDRKSLMCAIKKKGAYAGFIMGKPTQASCSVMLLNTLLVAPAYRKNGYGKRLVAFFLSTAFSIPQTRKVILHFRDSNKKILLPFYKKLGFGNHSIRGFYTNGELKHYMSLTKKCFLKESKSLS
ncbi:MAG TPA: hypothetical protein DIC35_03235 [Candidatus Moranbacteria bacterium]|nr:hypothetical protein [Candidatus Moranbacteria bacterium]